MRSVTFRAFTSLAPLFTTLSCLAQAFVSPSISTSSSSFSIINQQGLKATSNENDFDGNQIQKNDFEQSRRSIFTSAASLAFTAVVGQAQIVHAEETNVKKALVLGATGFVGSQVVAKLKSLGVEVVGTSTDGRDGTFALNFMDSSIPISKEVEKLSSGCDAVISCVGSIGTPNDLEINGGTGLAAVGAKAAGVKQFVYVSVAPEVRDAAQNISFLKNYMEGKGSSESFIKNNFGSSYMFIEPTFIYGGDSFSVNPPRVAGFYGEFIESLLSSGIFRAAAKVSPGIIGIALEPPVSVDDVAGAAVAGALGYSTNVLDTYDKIREASASLK